LIEVKRSDFWEFDVEPYSYSGRAMYGKTCLAINADSMSDLIGFVQEVTLSTALNNRHPLQEFSKIMNAVRSDQMGLGLVYYWPSVHLVDPTPTPED